MLPGYRWMSLTDVRDLVSAGHVVSTERPPVFELSAHRGGGPSLHQHVKREEDGRE